jgi:hypothetical protein
VVSAPLNHRHLSGKDLSGFKVQVNNLANRKIELLKENAGA